MSEIRVFTTNDAGQTSQSETTVEDFLEMAVDVPRAWDELCAMLVGEAAVRIDSDMERRYEAGDALYEAMHTWVTSPHNADVLLDMHYDGNTLEMPSR